MPSQATTMNSTSGVMVFLRISGRAITGCSCNGRSVNLYSMSPDKQNAQGAGGGRMFKRGGEAVGNVGDVERRETSIGVG